jgi:hypothetical protein
LDDGAVDAEFVLCWCSLGRGGGGFRNEGLEDAVDDAGVPLLGAGVVVVAGGGEGSVAGVVADLAEARGWDGLGIVVSKLDVAFLISHAFQGRFGYVLDREDLRRWLPCLLLVVVAGLVLFSFRIELVM